MSDKKAEVLAALATVIEPELHKDIVSLNMVRDLMVDTMQILVSEFDVAEIITELKAVEF